MSRFEIIQLNNIRLILKTTPRPLRLLSAHWDHCDRSLGGKGGPWRKHRDLFILIFCRCQFWHKLSERHSGICKVLSPTKCLQKERLGLTSRRQSNRIAFPTCTFEMGIAPLKPPSAGPKDFAEMVLSMWAADPPFHPLESSRWAEAGWCFLNLRF